MTASFLPPLVSFDSLGLAEANDALRAWGHKMGAFNRPNYGNRVRAHGLRHHGELVGLTITDRAIAARVAGIDRDDLIELARVCAARRDLNRVIVRLWREFVFPAIAEEWGARLAISYQHAALHSGDLYRFDGWKKIGASHSGTDKRSGRKGYSKFIWAYPPRKTQTKSRAAFPQRAFARAAGRDPCRSFSSCLRGEA